MSAAKWIRNVAFEKLKEHATGLVGTSIFGVVVGLQDYIQSKVGWVSSSHTTLPTSLLVVGGIVVVGSLAEVASQRRKPISARYTSDTFSDLIWEWPAGLDGHERRQRLKARCPKCSTPIAWRVDHGKKRSSGFCFGCKTDLKGPVTFAQLEEHGHTTLQGFLEEAAFRRFDSRQFDGTWKDSPRRIQEAQRAARNEDPANEIDLSPGEKSKKK
jgi:hypothetical protein